jgi:tetratricopeptide (TPR) repeat protein/CHAT domain-containing protein
MWKACLTINALMLMAFWGTGNSVFASTMEYFHDDAIPGFNVAPDETERNAATNCVEKLSSELDTVRQSGDRKGEAIFLVQMADILIQIGRTDEAVKSYQMAANIFKDIQDYDSEISALNKSGALYTKVGTLDRALDFYEKVLYLQRKAGKKSGQITTLIELASVYEILGQYHRQLDCYETAINLAVSTDDKLSYGLLLQNIGRAKWLMGKGHDALKHFEQALRVQREIGDLAGSYKTIKELIMVRIAWGQFAVALDLCDKELKQRENNPDNTNLGQILIAKCTVLKELGDYDEAQILAEMALKLSADRKHCTFASEIIVLLTDIHRLKGDTKRALAKCNLGLEWSRKNSDRNSESDFLVSMARVYSSEGLFSEAMNCLDGAEKIKKDIGSPLDHVLLGRGQIALESGQNLAMADSAIENYPFKKESLAGLMRGRIALTMGNFSKALELFNGVSSDLQIKLVMGIGSGLSQEGLGHLDEAQAQFTNVIKGLEQVRDSLEPSSRRYFFRVNSHGFNRTLPYEAMCRILQSRGKNDQALKIAEMTKARSFSDVIISGVMAPSLTPPENVLADDADLAYRVEMLKAVMLEKGQIYVSESGHEGTLERLREHRYRHIRKLRQMYPVFAAVRYPEPMSLDELALKPEEWALEYEVTDTGIVGFLLHGREIQKTFFTPIQRKELEKLIVSFRRPLDVDDSSELTKSLESFDLRLGRKLGELLVGPVLFDLPEAVTVIVAPDEILGLIPFEMLVMNDSGKIVIDESGIPKTQGVSFLGDRNPVTYAQSLTALSLVRFQSAQKIAGSRVMAMVDPVFSIEDSHFNSAPIEETKPNTDGYSAWTRNFLMSVDDRMTFPRLEQTRTLGLFVKNLYPAQSDIFEGMDANKSRLLTSELTKYKALTFATHGYSGCDLPGIAEPVIALTLVNQPDGQDGFLRMSEVVNLRMNADIVALTGCKTGIGKYVTGEGAMFMGRAFQTAGSANVMISLWNVAEDPSVKLTQLFFKYVHDGKTVSEAFHEARRYVRKEYDHPFFWAAFILMGGEN